MLWVLINVTVIILIQQQDIISWKYVHWNYLTRVILMSTHNVFLMKSQHIAPHLFFRLLYDYKHTARPCETSHVLLAGVSGGFPGVLPFRPIYQLARLDMIEIILKGTLN